MTEPDKQPPRYVDLEAATDSYKALGGRVDSYAELSKLASPTERTT